MTPKEEDDEIVWYRFSGPFAVRFREGIGFGGGVETTTATVDMDDENDDFIGPYGILGFLHSSIFSMVVSGSPQRWEVGGIVHPPIGRKNATYSPCLLGGEKCYRSHLLGEPETDIFSKIPKSHIVEM